MTETDVQDIINNVQDLLDQLCTMGIQSMLVTVNSRGEKDIHGSQRGQIFLKENSDVVDRFVKICADIHFLNGTESCDNNVNFHDEMDKEYLCKSKSDLEGMLFKPDYLCQEPEINKKVIKQCGTEPESECYVFQPCVSESYSKQSTQSSEPNVHMKSAIIKLTRCNTQNVRIESLPSGTVKVTETQPSWHNLTTFLKKDFHNDGIETNRSDELKNSTPALSIVQLPAISSNAETYLIDSKAKSSVGRKDSNIALHNYQTLNCSNCHVGFDSHVAHNKHLRSKLCFISDDDTLPFGEHFCDVCNIVFPTLDCVMVHKQVHNDAIAEGFQVTFHDIYNDIITVYKCKDFENFKCTHCSYVYQTKKLLIHHILKQHGASYLCTVCNAGVDSKSKMISHRKTHFDGKRCLAAGENKQDTESWNDLESIDKVNPKIVKRFKFEECGIEFERKQPLNDHMERLHSSQTFACDQCKKVFSTQQFLQMHKEVHKINFVCEVRGCNKGFNQRAAYKKHKKTHEEQSVVCSFCGKTFVSALRLNGHLQYHRTDRSFICQVCHKGFNTKDILTQHERIHMKTRPYCCEICGWGCNQVCSLKKHMDAHNNIKRYKCDACGKHYSGNTSLINHKLITNHFSSDDIQKNAKLLGRQCEYCERKFPSGSDYMYHKHLIVHTGEKPHKCTVCDKSFNDKSNLRYHMLIHSDIKPFVCKNCGRGFIQKRALHKHLANSSPCAVVGRHSPDRNPRV